MIFLFKFISTKKFQKNKYNTQGVLGFWGFLGGFFWRNFFEGIFWEDFFGRIFLRGYFWEELLDMK